MTNLRTLDAWHNVHQPFELEWWTDALSKGHYAEDEAFMRHWAPVVDFIKPHGRVLDIGCGARPPFAPCTVIDPLVDEYRKITPAYWWDNTEQHAVPAETLIEECLHEFDTVICWNAIDHAFGWLQILDNMRLYGAPDARFAIATDFYPPFVGHPGFERNEFMRAIGERFKIIDKREPFGRHLALLLTAR